MQHVSTTEYLHDWEAQQPHQQEKEKKINDLNCNLSFMALYFFSLL